MEIDSKTPKDTFNKNPKTRTSYGLPSASVCPDLPRGSVSNLVDLYEKRIRKNSPKNSYAPGRADDRSFNTNSKSATTNPSNELPDHEVISKNELSVQTEDWNDLLERQKNISSSYSQIYQLESFLNASTLKETGVLISAESILHHRKDALNIYKQFTTSIMPSFDKDQKNGSILNYSNIDRWKGRRNSDINIIPNSRNEDYYQSFVTEVDLLCVNCYECIPINEVNKHSHVCTVPKVEENECIYIDARVRKIVNAIFSRVIEASGERLTVLKHLQDLGNAILTQSMKPVKILEQLSSISNLDNIPKIGASCIVFAKRLIHLMESRIRIKRNEKFKKSTLASIEDNSPESNKDLAKWKFKPDMLHHIARPTGLSKVSSGVGSHFERPSGDSYISNNQDANPSFSENNSHTLEEYSNEELEKYFFTVALSKKMEFPTNHPVNTVSISQLFKKCKAENIPPAYWDNYIVSEYSKLC
ncbi:unnamed protein product [Blepharisma stoltei]|uniref:Uncharacterized protein n=1 Tax=Blepharisma stoltei TaxID=1481888 RepID=A0AAU9J5M7_9CILI|nr:unnamed protein product [Blepharisma stoltei]